MSDAAKKIMQRINALAKISDEQRQLTRTFASPAMRRANDTVASWMRDAGMTTRADAIGNLIGRYEGTSPNAKTLILGSHLDTVRNAGKFDGPLGVILALACVEELQRTKCRLPFAIEAVGFCDEEGVRYQSTYLGSRVLAGCFEATDLLRKDASGVTMADAIKAFGGAPQKIPSAKLNPKKVLAYVEVHIEQGPVLEEKNLAVGVVTTIAGQSRIKLTFTGKAGHAGTTPMSLRQDALCAAAEFILAVERYGKEMAGLVATVGQIQNTPNASNVIPGEVSISLDVRHQRDAVRRAAVKQFQAVRNDIEKERRVKIASQVIQETDSVPCSLAISNLLQSSALKKQRSAPQLSSGAGHDAAVMAQITPVGMLFVRCKGGVSHHPDESVQTSDVQVALEVMNDFIDSLAKHHG
ncbi:MAG: allantoate amidohydrolase [Verrucomicrobiales bacterium]|nr:allantoate amidohydrolase [Verrucomicrobiales bacterium]